jgi:hypothetical protein
VHYKFLATKKKKISRVVLNKPKKTFEVRQNRMIQKKEEKKEKEKMNKQTNFLFKSRKEIEKCSI